jgi:hypothetical protein
MKPVLTCKNCGQPVYVANHKPDNCKVNGMVFHVEASCTICFSDLWTEDYKGPFAELRDEDK